MLVVFLGAFLGYSIQTKGGGLQGVIATFLGQDAEKLKNLDTITVLLCGVSEDLDSKLTDTIMVCSYNPKTQRASMLSIPRDTFIGKSKTSAKGTDKINSVYSRKGIEKLVDYAEKITGINIEYYVIVNNKVVIDVVNAIGGVSYDVPINMNYDDSTQNLHIHLKKGPQRLNGDQAEQLLRFRHNNDGTSYPPSYGDNDFGRMKTQRDFITEVLKQAISIKNITHLKTMMTTFYENVKTNLVLDDVLPYVSYGVNFNTENIASYQLPGNSEQCNELWFYTYDKIKTEEIVEDIEDYLAANDKELTEESENKISNSVN